MRDEWGTGRLVLSTKCQDIKGYFYFGSEISLGQQDGANLETGKPFREFYEEAGGRRDKSTESWSGGLDRGVCVLGRLLKRRTNMLRKAGLVTKGW